MIGALWLFIAHRCFPYQKLSSVIRRSLCAVGGRSLWATGGSTDPR